ncbi:MAG: amidohydrolase family protein, partial [Pseudomonadota bacterium]
MIRRALASLALVLAACGGENEPVVSTPTENVDPAQLIVKAALVHTGDGAPIKNGAVAIKIGRIVYVGAATGVEAYQDDETQIVDLGGGVLYPGFTDAHVHLVGIGMRELTLNLDAVGSIGELVGVVEAEVAKRGPGEPIVGRGWIETQWPEGRAPAAADIDPVSPDNPVILQRSDGHATLVNSAALAAAGIGADTPDPEGGAIERDADGAPTGVLIDNAENLVAGLVAAPSPAMIERAYAVGGQLYASRGWTGVHNMSVDYAHLPVMERLAASGDLPIRVYNAVDLQHIDKIARDMRLGPRFGGDGRVITRAVKVYFDGALGSRGAALFEPYADRPETRGLVLLNAEDADAAFAKAREAGLQVAAHAI